jgi:hypothetical protein
MHFSPGFTNIRPIQSAFARLKPANGGRELIRLPQRNRRLSLTASQATPIDDERCSGDK